MLVIPGVHEIGLGFVNAFLIEDAGGLTLIDTGIPGHHRKIIAYLKEIGKTPKDIKRILATHSDVDHIGSLAAMKKRSGATVYASAVEAEGIARGKSTRASRVRKRSLVRRILMSTMLRVKPVVVDETLKEGDELPVRGGLVAVETFGHTPGHLSFLLKDGRVLFCGDSLRVDNGVLISSRPDYTDDAEQAEASYRKQAALKPAVICFGHGPFAKDPAALFAAR